MIVRNDVHYRRLLGKVNRILQISNDRGYKCCLVGCCFKAPRHRDYICHLRDVHPSLTMFTCNFKKSCNVNTVDFNSLVAHNEHVIQATTVTLDLVNNVQPQPLLTFKESANVFSSVVDRRDSHQLESLCLT